MKIQIKFFKVFSKGHGPQQTFLNTRAIIVLSPVIIYPFNPAKTSEALAIFTKGDIFVKKLNQTLTQFLPQWAPVNN